MSSTSLTPSATNSSVTTSGTAPASSTSDVPSFPPRQSGMPPGAPCNDPQGCNAPPPATLYLYTFLSTLIILLMVSGGIIARSVVLRRRQQIAIANGTWVSPTRRRESHYTTRPKPVMFDAYVAVDGKNGKEERWATIKPFFASDVAPHIKCPLPPPHPETLLPSRAMRDVFYNPFRPPPAPPPPAVEPVPPPLPAAATQIRVATLIAMPSQDMEDLPYLEFGVLEADVVDHGKMSCPVQGRLFYHDHPKSNTRPFKFCPLVGGVARIFLNSSSWRATAGSNSRYLTAGDWRLFAQEGSEVPVYGREAPITGAILIEEAVSVSGVILQVQGKMEVTVMERGSMAATTVRDRYILWPEGRGLSCPPTLSFSVVLPATFRSDNHAEHQIPPSYNITLPGFFAKSVYSLRISVTRNTHGFEFLSLAKTMLVPFRYICGLRAPRQLPRTSHDFLRDVKINPADWRQTSLPLSTLPTISAEGIQLSLFLPSAQVCHVKDVIPFHLQVTASFSLLQQLQRDHGGSTPAIQSSIQRDIIVQMHGCPSKRTIGIGYGNIWLSAREEAGTRAQRTAVLDWDGELRCNSDVLIGAFDGGLIKVKDFVVVEISLPGIGSIRHIEPIMLASNV
ncbi:hypothetical protein DFH09DRAFT_1407508 [Mycena vulgaris]|nr:hypothetical protein DFH09DRAFT_1407508 [Mycena vulgaris]